MAERERAFFEEVVSTNRLTDLAAVKGSFWVMERPSAGLDFQKVLRRISYGAGRRTTSRDFVARGRPPRGQKRFAPLAKRSTCSKSSAGHAAALHVHT